MYESCFRRLCRFSAIWLPLLAPPLPAACCCFCHCPSALTAAAIAVLLSLSMLYVSHLALPSALLRFGSFFCCCCFFAALAASLFLFFCWLFSLGWLLAVFSGSAMPLSDGFAKREGRHARARARKKDGHHHYGGAVWSFVSATDSRQPLCSCPAECVPRPLSC